MAKYTVYTLDVWGNAKDGWDVNDRCRVGFVDIPDDASESDILRIMVDSDVACGPISTATIRDSDGSFIEIDRKKDGRPLFTLEREPDGE